jgi:hypothetical protein
MSEIQELKEARNLIALNQNEKALPLLWKLYASKNPDIKLEAGLVLIGVLDQLTENKKLLEISGETIKVASDLGREDLRAYVSSRRAIFLSTNLASLTYRKRNLNLAAGVFRWIDFSLEKDKKEYEAIIVKCNKLDKEISALEVEVFDFAQSTTDHYLRGHIFMSLGEISFSRFLNDQLDLMIGGKWRSKICNIYFVRRWKLDKLINYDKDGRRKLKASRNKCIDFFEKAISEFKLGDHKADLAHALYNLAVKFTLMFYFSKAKRYLNQAKPLAEATNEKVLLIQVTKLETQIKDKYKHPRNYAEEFGLDLPRPRDLPEKLPRAMRQPTK